MISSSRILIVGEDEGDDVGPLLGSDVGLLEGEPVVTGFGVGSLFGEEVGVAVIGPVEGDVCQRRENNMNM